MAYDRPDYGALGQMPSAGNLAGASVQRPSQVESEFSRIERAVGRLHEAIGELEKRFSPVLQSTPPAAVENAKQPHDVSVALAARLVNQRVGIEHATGWLRAIIERCEL